jgi:four helix bundle protein
MEGSDDKIEFRQQMMKRTKQLSLRIIRLSQSLVGSREADVIARQILRAGTSVGANYRAACRARSGAEFHSKMSIVIEECDECLFWMELLVEANLIGNDKIQDLYRETEEILKIIVVARKNAARPSKS